MQTTRKPTLNWLLTGGLMLGLAAASQAAITTIADTFTLNGTTRTAGTALGGLTTEVGGVIWKTTSDNFYFNAAGAVDAVAWQTPQASVALPAATGTVTLTAYANPSHAYGGVGDWCAIGFMTNDSVGWWTGGGARQLWMYLKDDGVWAFGANDDAQSLGGGNIGAVGTGFHALSISYDPNTNKAMMSIDGITKVNWTTLNLTPTLGAATIRVTQTRALATGNQQFDNFYVTTVPEPASLGLLLLAGGLLAARRRR